MDTLIKKLKLTLGKLPGKVVVLARYKGGRRSTRVQGRPLFLSDMRKVVVLARYGGGRHSS